jgi:hypothetical protein
VLADATFTIRSIDDDGDAQKCDFQVAVLRG